MYESEYPRPGLRRRAWQNLNGIWDLNGTPIRVPYPPQSSASGFAGEIPEKLHYTVRFPFHREEERVLLQFGAIDQICEVFLNGQSAGMHEGGYLPFSLDVSGLILEGENVLEVLATDALDPRYPYGKQSKKPHGIWYTPVSGIWQTVWLEQVPKVHVRSLRITPDLTGIDLEADGADDGFSVEVLLRGELVTRFRSERCACRIDIPSPELWTPENPVLYEIVLRAGRDEVKSWFALRTVGTRVVNGVPRLLLNGKPVFLNGLLDQGYHSDGLFIPAHEGGFEKDILTAKRLGFNMLRKHIKVEPEIWYHLCDRAGMLVLQDMVNSGTYRFFRDSALGTAGIRIPDRTGTRGLRKEFFIRHMLDTARHLHSHPCVIGWTIFNEGWGQFESGKMYSMLKAEDPTRPVDSASGWFRPGKTDLDSLHIYFRTKRLRPGKKRPMLLSECGGFSLPVPGHTQAETVYGYGACDSGDALTGRMESLYERMVLPAVPAGLCGCVYTQLSDVESEMNGIMTYDRTVTKPDKERLSKLSLRLRDALEEACAMQEGSRSGARLE